MNSTLDTVKGITKRSFATLGLDIRRKRSRTSTDFYETVETCQIENLSYIYELFLGRRESGQFVEVGAYDGITYSNSWGLAERGWHGLLVEPVPHLAALARREHKTHSGVQVAEVAAGASEGSLSLNIGGPFTTADQGHKDIYNSTQWVAKWMTGDSVEVIQSRLDTILVDRKVQPDFDVLIVDVEGFESNVFAGFSMSEWMPKMIIVELEVVHSIFTSSRKSHFQLGRMIQSSGYDVVYRDAVNTIFIRTDVAERAIFRSEEGQASPSGSVVIE